MVGSEFHLRRAQVRATLLAANESRIGNLISMLGVLLAAGNTTDARAKIRALESRIDAALGLPTNGEES